jgi:hypothetical protein
MHFGRDVDLRVVATVEAHGLEFSRRHGEIGINRAPRDDGGGLHQVRIHFLLGGIPRGLFRQQSGNLPLGIGADFLRRNGHA